MIKKKSVLILLLLSFITFFENSCSTTKIATNKSADFNEKISSVYVIIKCAKDATKFSKAFAEEFKKGLLLKKVSSRIYFIDPLSFTTEKDINEGIVSFGPQVVMSFIQSEIKSSSGYWTNKTTMNGGVFDIVIEMPVTKVPVWKASMEFNLDNGYDQSVRNAAIDLIKKMSKDNLL